jgi:hypothetical protein
MNCDDRSNCRAADCLAAWSRSTCAEKPLKAAALDTLADDARAFAADFFADFFAADFLLDFLAGMRTLLLGFESNSHGLISKRAGRFKA